MALAVGKVRPSGHSIHGGWWGMRRTGTGKRIRVGHLGPSITPVNGSVDPHDGAHFRGWGHMLKRRANTPSLLHPPPHFPPGPPLSKPSLSHTPNHLPAPPSTPSRVDHVCVCVCALCY